MYRGRFHSGDKTQHERGEFLPQALRNRDRDKEMDCRHGQGLDGEGVGGARIACLLAADFPIAATMRANPALRDQPFAMVRTGAMRGSCRRGQALYYPHSELAEVAPRARNAGVRAGMTVAQGRALMPDLIIAPVSVAAERSAADALADVAESISPIVEEGAPGQVWADLSGSAQFYRHALGIAELADETAGETTLDRLETALGNEMVRRAGRVGLAIAVGIGSSKTIAQLAARCCGVRIIAPGQEREFLDWLPLDLLESGPIQRHNDLEQAFKRLGLRRLGDLARLDVRAIGSRFGERGVELVRLARGEGSARLAVRPRTEVYSECAELDYGIESLEPISFVLRAMLTQLTERLKLRGLAAGAITLSLGLVDRRRDERRVAVAASTTEANALLTLVNLSLENAPPPAAVETIRLTIEPRAARPAQSDMFLPPMPAPARLEAAIARIAALYGPDRVGTLASAASYRPEAVRLGTFAPGPATAPASGGSTGRIVMRALRPAEEVEVMCTRETPAFVRGRTVCARVVSAAGPWRYQGEWWAEASSAPLQSDCDNGMAGDWQASAPSAYARDYYELALADGGVYRVYCDRYSMQWFVDGVYD